MCCIVNHRSCVDQLSVCVSFQLCCEGKEMHKKGSKVPAIQTSGFFSTIHDSNSGDEKESVTVWLAQEVVTKIRYVYLRCPHHLPATCSGRVILTIPDEEAGVFSMFSLFFLSFSFFSFFTISPRYVLYILFTSFLPWQIPWLKQNSMALFAVKSRELPYWGRFLFLPVF